MKRKELQDIYDDFNLKKSLYSLGLYINISAFWGVIWFYSVSFSYRLRITVQIGNGEFRFAEYENFKVDSEENNYALHVSGYSSSSTAGNTT